MLYAETAGTRSCPSRPAYRHWLRLGEARKSSEQEKEKKEEKEEKEKESESGESSEDEGAKNGSKSISNSQYQEIKEANFHSIEEYYAELRKVYNEKNQYKDPEFSDVKNFFGSEDAEDDEETVNPRKISDELKKKMADSSNLWNDPTVPLSGFCTVAFLPNRVLFRRFGNKKQRLRFQSRARFQVIQKSLLRRFRRSLRPNRGSRCIVF